MTAASSMERSVTEAVNSIREDAGVCNVSAEPRLFTINNWEGVGYETFQGQNHACISFVESWGVFPWLPGGRSPDAELEQLQQARDDFDPAADFRRRAAQLIKQSESDPSLRAPGRWGRDTWSDAQISSRSRQLTHLFVTAQRGDLIVMFDSGAKAQKAPHEVEYAVGVFTTGPTGIQWMEPDQIGAVHDSSPLLTHVSVDGDSGFVQTSDCEWQKALSGPLAVRPVSWRRWGRRVDLPASATSTLRGLLAPTIARAIKDVEALIKAVLAAAAHTRHSVGQRAAGSELAVNGPAADHIPSANGDDAGLATQEAVGAPAAAEASIGPSYKNTGKEAESWLALGGGAPAWVGSGMIGELWSPPRPPPSNRTGHWGGQQPKVSKLLADVYGSHDAAFCNGWRWAARPGDRNDHLHHYWPPEELQARLVPLKIPACALASCECMRRALTAQGTIKLLEQLIQERTGSIQAPGVEASTKVPLNPLLNRKRRFADLSSVPATGEAKFQVDQKVNAKYKAVQGGTDWFPGRIGGINCEVRGRTYNILYDDGGVCCCLVFRLNSSETLRVLCLNPQTTRTAFWSATFEP